MMVVLDIETSVALEVAVKNYDGVTTWACAWRTGIPDRREPGNLHQPRNRLAVWW